MRPLSLLPGTAAAVLLAGIAFPAGQEPFLRVEYQDAPQARVEAGRPALLILPTAFRKVLEESFPGYRLPGNMDYQGHWSEGMCREDHPVPFLSLGDFDGDGRQDIAVILIHKKSRAGKFLIFNGVPGGYRPYGLPQSWLSELHAQGFGLKPWGPCVSLFAFESVDNVVCWDKRRGRYALQEEGPPL